MIKPLHSFTDDFELWQAFKAGKEAAFDSIYDQYFPSLYGYGTRLCPDKSLIKDCIQNLFVELWKNRSHLSDVYSIKHYLYQSLRRSLVKEMVAEKKYLHPDELSEDYYFEVTFSHERLLIGEQVAQENINRLQRAFQLLTKRQKEAVFLRFYESLEYPAIAEIMVLKEVKYARTLVYRALDVLKASIRRLASVE
jgi:RNA polymerase sigma factor (sigma-70 family)